MHFAGAAQQERPQAVAERSPRSIRYEGEWRDNKRDGQGVYVTTDGTVYSGAWSKGCLRGMTEEQCDFR